MNFKTKVIGSAADFEAQFSLDGKLWARFAKIQNSTFEAIERKVKDKQDLYPTYKFRIIRITKVSEVMERTTLGR